MNAITLSPLNLKTLMSPTKPINTDVRASAGGKPNLLERIAEHSYQSWLKSGCQSGL